MYGCISMFFDKHWQLNYVYDKFDILATNHLRIHRMLVQSMEVQNVDNECRLIWRIPL